MVELNYNVLDIINLMKTLSVHQHEDNIDRESLLLAWFSTRGIIRASSHRVHKMRVWVYTWHFSCTTEWPQPHYSHSSFFVTYGSTHSVKFISLAFFPLNLSLHVFFS